MSKQKQTKSANKTKQPRQQKSNSKLTPQGRGATPYTDCHWSTRIQMGLSMNSGDHMSGKPGNVREFTKNQGNVREKILLGKSCLKLFIVSCMFPLIQVFSTSTDMIWVTLNMRVLRKSAVNRQGISHCLESGHHVKCELYPWIPQYMNDIFRQWWTDSYIGSLLFSVTTMWPHHVTAELSPIGQQCRTALIWI